MKIFGFVCLLILLACSCNKKQSQNPVVAVKALQQFVSLSIQFSKVVKAEDQSIKKYFGDRKILMSCKGKAEYGCDFGLVSDKDISINNNQIKIKLPPIQQINFSIDPLSIKQDYTNIGVLRSDFTTEERSNLLKQAEVQIQQQLNKLNYEQQAKTNAIQAIETLLQNLGFTQIIVE